EETKYDVIYTDPSRRHDSKGKVFFLKDCEPNIPENLELLLNNCKQLLVKTSPMLDITVGLKELKYVSEIHIVAVNNEVKELLWLLDKNIDDEPKVKTINFNKSNKEEFDFGLNNEEITSYALPLTYLYVPNASIMKSGAFGLLSERFQLDKLHKHTHLYTSKKLKDFPGRRFIIKNVIPYHKKEIKDFLKNKKANIATRNFPESVSTIRKKWGIKDGGSKYLFFTTLENNQKVILDCSKV
ncbi:MAG: class I SAM-dependent methyltransferase, partial [Bacteroidetes bacterium]|nr:class I SAM-dependent methyltransferase [Bacteroidota bacterium]